MLNNLFKKLRQDTSGSVALEAIWMGVFVGFFVTPTTFLMQNAKMGLDASWNQRTAARNEAINDNCSNFEIVLPPVNVTMPQGVIAPNNSNIITNKLITNIITCSEKDAEDGIASGQKFWKRMETESQNNGFKAIIDDVANPSLIPAYEGASSMAHQNLGMKGRTMTFYSYIPQVALPAYITTSSLLVPTDDTFTFENDTYAAGHDKRIWADLPSGDGRNLYSDVFPSK